MLDVICLDFSKTFDMVHVGNASDIWEERDEYYNCMIDTELTTRQPLAFWKLNFITGEGLLMVFLQR